MDSPQLNFQRIATLISENDTRRKATAFADILLDFSNNNFENLNNFLDWGKTYRITIEELQDESLD